MKAQGVVKGTLHEILSACESYGYHPLSLRLLSGLIVRDLKDPGDISVSRRYDIHANLKARRHHIMEVAFSSLPNILQRLLSGASAFRGTIKYEAFMILSEYEDEPKFEEGLKELIDFGLLLFNKDNKHFDLHPIVQRYAYEKLSDKNTIHERLRNYFIDNLSIEEVKSLEDINQLIEIYYHTARAGLYEGASMY
jgi:hypothetical protein